MSLFCGNKACKAQKGACNHEKIGIAVLILGGAAAVAHWCLNLI
jgi:hypothetical protein